MSRDIARMGEFPCIIFAPHQDDETLGCAGIIQKKVKSRQKVYIVWITDGRNTFSIPRGITKDPVPEEVKFIRRHEAMQAAELFGVPRQNLIFLNYEDGYLSTYEKEARFPIKTILSKIKPAEVFIPWDPLGDHGTAKRIVLYCLSALKMNPIVYEYFAHGRKEQIIQIQDKIVLDISEEINTKIKALEEVYVSETTLYAKGQKVPVLTEESLKRFREPVEYFIRRR